MLVSNGNFSSYGNVDGNLIKFSSRLHHYVSLWHENNLSHDVIITPCIHSLGTTSWSPTRCACSSSRRPSCWPPPSSSCGRCWPRPPRSPSPPSRSATGRGGTGASPPCSSVSQSITQLVVWRAGNSNSCRKIQLAINCMICNTLRLS